MDNPEPYKEAVKFFIRGWTLSTIIDLHLIAVPHQFTRACQVRDLMDGTYQSCSL